MIFRGENMIKTTNMLLDELHSYANPVAKLSRMVKSGEIYPITKGLYETDRNVPGHLLAGSIYGPSYISFEYALAYYGLIPEAVYAVTCATFEKKKKKKYETAFGTFIYRDVPADVFPFELKIIKEREYYFRIAEPEKALCDKLYTISPVSNIKELASVVFDNLRIEEEDIIKMDICKVGFLAERYHSTNVKKFVALLRRVQK